MNRRHGGGRLTGWRASDNAHLNHAHTADNARIKAAMQAPATPPIPAAQEARGQLPVYYLHGEESKAEPGRYWCWACRQFVPLSHFEGAHDMTLDDHIELQCIHTQFTRLVHLKGYTVAWTGNAFDALRNHAESARIEAAMQTPPTPQTAREPCPAHYLHGDQHETRAGVFLCKRCDLFQPADHFTQGAHGMALADHLDLRARHRDNVKRVQRAGGFCGREAMAGNVFADLRRTNQTGGLHD